MGRKGACVIPQTLESNVIELHHFLFGDEEYTPTETVRTISQKIVSDTGVHGTKQAETKALPKTTEATTISILDPTQESGADESQEAESGSDESEKETGNASKHRTMTFLSRKVVRTVRMHQRKMRGRAVRQSLAVFRRHFRAEILAPARRRMAEKNLPAAVPEWKQCTGK